MTKYFNHEIISFRPSEEEIREYKEEFSAVDWKYFSYNYDLSKDFLREFKEKIDKREAVENKSIDFTSFCELINNTNFEEQMNWKIIFLVWRYDKEWITREEVENIIKTDLIMFFSDWDWHVILELINVSDKFIREEMVTRNMWEDISSMKNLRDAIIDRYSNKLNWGLISALHQLDDRFVNKYKNKLNQATLDKRLRYG